MFIKRRLGVLAAVAAALAVGAPVASASAATIARQWIVPSSCAVTNAATGCASYWAIHGSPALTDRSSEALFPVGSWEAQRWCRCSNPDCAPTGTPGSKPLHPRVGKILRAVILVKTTTSMIAPGVESRRERLLVARSAITPRK
jgi:hypothetical protein